MKKIVCTVTTDLNYDQRMIRICSALVDCGYQVTLIGRKRPHSKPFSEKPYKQVHLNGYFESGFLFYAEYNIRLILYLIKNSFDVYNACDLDTILPCTIIAQAKNKPLVYDAHEYFTEQEEIVNRPLVKKIWKAIEKSCVPKVQKAYTVSKGYAKLFEKEYSVPFSIVRNVTRLQNQPNFPSGDNRQSYILYQGAVNEGRGLRELIKAMKLMPTKQLKICGLGDIHEELIALAKAENVDNRVNFEGYVKPEDLKAYTNKAALGITLFANQGLSHKYSLANRFFDYMHAGIPQIGMEYPEYISFNQEYKVAHLISSLDPESIANGINHILNNEDVYMRFVEQALQARAVHNFSTDAQNLCSIYSSL